MTHLARVPRPREASPAESTKLALVGNELAWVARIRAGDETAFEAAFRLFYEPLVRYAARRLGAIDSAEDIVHDTLLTIWRQRGAFEVRGSLAGYLFGAVRNRLLNHGRHQRVVRKWEPLFASGLGVPGTAAHAETPDARLAARERDEAIRTVVSALPARQHEALALRIEHGLSFAEVAEAMSISIRAAETHYFRAVQFLRARLADVP